MTHFSPLDGFTILGTGRALPARTVDNAQLLAHAGAAWSPEQLATALGVETRRWTHTPGAPADHGEATSQDLAIEAARAALADAGLAAGDLGAVLVATTTAPRPSVSTANHVACALGVEPGFLLELKAGCTSALYGLTTAASLIAMGAGPVLLIAAEAWTKLMPGEIPGPGAVAGDGAGAVVLGRGTGAFLGASFLSEPAHAAAMMPPGLYPATPEAIAAGDYHLRFSEEVGEAIRALYPRAFAAALTHTGLTADAVDLLIPHQPSGPIVRRALKDCGIPHERAFHTLARYGNVSSASVLLSLHDARASGRLVPGMRVALLGAGGGLTAACVLLRV